MLNDHTFYSVIDFLWHSTYFYKCEVSLSFCLCLSLCNICVWETSVSHRSASTLLASLRDLQLWYRFKICTQYVCMCALIFSVLSFSSLRILLAKWHAWPFRDWAKLYLQNLYLCLFLKCSLSGFILSRSSSESEGSTAQTLLKSRDVTFAADCPPCILSVFPLDVKLSWKRLAFFTLYMCVCV